MLTTKGQLAKYLSVVISLVALTFLGTSVWAQPNAGSPAKQLVGHWTLVSVTFQTDGKTVDAFGPNPKGLFIYDSSGRYSIVITRPGVPKFASNARDSGTADENKAAVQGSLAHFGTYTVNEKEGSYTVKIEASSVPNWVDTEQKRLFSVTGDELKITNPTSSVGAGAAQLVLKRAK